MKEKLFFFSLKHPLLYILLLAVVLKIIAVFFTSGYMIDGHYFNYYHIPLKWLDNAWLVYPVRIALGAFSLFIITISYRIVKIIADKTTALEVALLLAALWSMPYVTVHPLPQVVCLPFLLYGTLLIVKQHDLMSNDKTEKFHRTSLIIAGFCFGLGFAVYYQSFIFYLGIVLALLILKKWKGALLTLTGYVIAVLFTQTIIDLIIWHRPFVNMIKFFSNNGEYLFNNMQNWYFDSTSIVVVMLYLVVIPLSIMLVFGFFRVWRKYLLLFVPTFMVLLFYTIFPNRLWIYTYTLIPTFIITGFVGWKEYYKNSSFWTSKRWLSVTCYVIFAVINTIVYIWSFFPNFFTK